MRNVLGYAAQRPGDRLAQWAFERRDVLASDVVIRVDYCGVCHSDLHGVRSDAMSFPLVPGHEIVGEVVEVGSAVTRFRAGDQVVMGTMVDSCRRCSPCHQQIEPYCNEGPTQTFGSPQDRHGDGPTKGGYSTEYVVDQWFVYHFPAGLDPAGVAPLLCAGVTTWSPLRHWNVGEGSKVGIIGLGGLGHLAIKFAKALGANVTAFTTSERKGRDASRLGADTVIVSSDEEAMKTTAGKLDFILSTAPAAIDFTPYLAALRYDGTLCALGVSGQTVSLNTLPLTMGRLAFASSAIAGTRETDEMLDFCARHGITADVEVIPMERINEAFDRMEKGDVHYRFVIDMRSLHDRVSA